MEPPSDSPGEVAKQTLTRLARERQAPLPENYCRTYRKVEGKTASWAAFCHYMRLLEDAIAELLAPWQGTDSAAEPETARLGREMGDAVAAAATEDDLKRVREIGHALGLKVKRDLAAGAQRHADFLDLIRLVVSHLAALADDDHWLRSELQATRELLAGDVGAAELAKARDVLVSTIERQLEMRQRMADAQEALKGVMAELIRQAASLVADTAGYEGKVAELGEHIRAANDLSAIKHVVGELDDFVRDMGSSVRRSHDAMSSTHARLLQAEQQILDLRQHLAETSEKARRDSLTGALNRSGLDDIWRREVARAQAGETPLSIGLLDVDNFKLLNDRLGHTVGDEALVHLTSVIRQALHGTDTMARYGGEEFVILLPDTDAAGAEALMRRLQRELTKHFFLHGNDRLLITFSAGVTVAQLGSDSLMSAIERADAALYEAKRQGKNRVARG